MSIGEPFLVCEKCAGHVYQSAVQNKLPRLYHGIYTVVGITCATCSGGDCQVVHRPATQIKLVSRVLLFDMALRSGQAFQRIKDVGEAMRDNWLVFFGRQRKMPKTITSSVSASITTEPKLFQRHSVDNTWAAKDVLQTFAEYVPICESVLAALNEEADAQAPGARERNAHLKQLRLEQQTARIQHTDTVLKARKIKLTPRQQVLQQAQFLIMTPCKRKEPKEEPLCADTLWSFVTQYYTEYCSLAGVHCTLHEVLPRPASASIAELHPGGALVRVLTDPECFAEWEKVYQQGLQDAPRPPQSKKQKLDHPAKVNGNEDFLKALKKSCADWQYNPSHLRAQWPVDECIKMKEKRYLAFPLPGDVGRDVQSTEKSCSTQDEQAAQQLYVQKWRAWVRSGGGACDMPECRPWDPCNGPGDSTLPAKSREGTDVVPGSAAGTVADMSAGQQDDNEDGDICDWEREKANDYVRMGTLVTDPFDEGAHPQRALLVDHLVLCEELEDCMDSARRAAYLQIGKYLKVLYAATKHKMLTPLAVRENKLKEEEAKEKGSLQEEDEPKK
uniref:Uncharacterized protein n=1 Tax=Eutreptiella gymnastica TaxID=73025 RepID=A0A7S4FS01_9EUGL